jgi:uncharacterized protein (DUF302 family)
MECNMADVSYGYTKKLEQIDFTTALSKVEQALKGEGFGVLTEIDVKATLKKKLDVEFRNYKILGACNPPIAHQALTNEIHIGLLLPCNVVVYENDDHTITVSMANPKKLFEVVERDDLAPMAEEVDAKIRRALDAV